MGSNIKRINYLIKDCDSRITALKDMIIHINMAGYVAYLESPDPKSNIKDILMRFYDNHISLAKIEKMVLQSLLKTNNDELFPKLLALYDEYMNESYDIAQTLVECGGISDTMYLKFCNKNLESRNHIKMLCEHH